MVRLMSYGLKGGEKEQKSVGNLSSYSGKGAKRQLADFQCEYQPSW